MFLEKNYPIDMLFYIKNNFMKEFKNILKCFEKSQSFNKKGHMMC